MDMSFEYGTMLLAFGIWFDVRNFLSDGEHVGMQVGHLYL